MKLKQLITNSLLNFPGWHTNRKIVVIESDDWGSIRMPSKEVYHQLIEKGIRVDRDPYCRYDSLATPADLEALFEVLQSVKDKHGKPAILTANTLVANPDFEKIRESGFESYYYEPFTETLKRNPNTEKSFSLWKEGMNSGVFHPQFHGREHLNIKKWLNDLKKGLEITLLGFKHGTFGFTSEVDPRINMDYMGAFNSGLPEDIAEYNTILTEGLNLFEDLFKFRSQSFIPTTYTWHPDIEPVLLKNGVNYLQGSVFQRVPIDDDTTFRFKRNNFTGSRSKAGLIYIARNAYFEPSQLPDINWVNECMRRIRLSFLFQKPAVIGAHRLNFIGAIDEENRKINLSLFKILLKEIVRKYPDVEFMCTDNLGEIIG